MVTAPGEVHLWVADLDAGAERAGELGGLLTPEERAEAAAYLLPAERARRIAARAFLRGVLGGYLGTPPERVRITREAGGRPVLEDGEGGIRFSLAHSRGCAVCAVAAGREVGADVERHRRFADPEAMAGRLLAPREMEAFRGLAPEARGPALLRCWTRKEAYLKATGEGVTRPMREVEVAWDGEGPAGLRAVGGDAGEAARWSVRETIPAPDFFCTVVAEGGPFRLARRPWSA